jgi:two-component system, OmpR family, phosphate regulon response regulator PhoB
MRVLVVEDDALVGDAVKRAIEDAGFAVDLVGTADLARTALRAESFDLVVLDIGLPRESGLRLLQGLRGRGETLPVLMLTARDALSDRVTALDLGADDYLTKPFSPQELSLRVRGLLRRLGSPPVTAGSTLAAGPISIDRSAHRATVGGEELSLTATEYKLLLTLVERRGRVQTRPQLLETVWEAQPDIQTRTVDMHVQRLRTKLGDAGRLIETVRGFGYRFKGTERGVRTR